MTAEQTVDFTKKIFDYKDFSVWIGMMVGKNDLPHYLVVNTPYNVIEYSTSKLMEARAMCVVLGEQTSMQDEAIRSGEMIEELTKEEKDKERVRREWN